MFTDYNNATTLMFFNLDEICLEQWGDAKYYESSTGTMTAVTNLCRGIFTTVYPSATIDSIETYENSNGETILKAICLKHNRNE